VIHVALAMPHWWYLLSLLPFVIGATITPTSTINPATMAANWTKGVTNNGQKWLNKYLNPRALFNANAAQSQLAWQAGINRAMALGTYATKLAAADPTMAANNASTFGVQNYATSGTTHAPKYAAKTAALASALSTVRAQVLSMPNATLQDRLARMAAMANGMAAYKGKI
jgi:hypothetical protein